ncbi:hypothetical protein Celaphus_00001704 [Cervus elaphus hippelaphus]|uniref:DUF4485 domain-containing protein n=1 Tax=Cervus elaphus hippelaphus TaxID=46360 RepID=A0A212D6U9_CEREH|nr:hypothetical protein Celaphus_00001704 [Cervus elaphus hippelaphus]
MGWRKALTWEVSGGRSGLSGLVPLRRGPGGGVPLCVCLERQRCALWIRKLCEPSGTGTGIPGRKNRNLYAKLLLHMLRRGVLEGPFTQRPEPGTLRALPSYMSIYFDEPNPAQAKGSSPDGLPDWVVGELGTSEHRCSESRDLSSGEDYSLVQSPTDVHRYA